MNNLTPELNELNIENVRHQIHRKKMSMPYHATTNQSVEVVTDYDTFPYPRYFRGVAESSIPIVAEREAGWRPRHDSCYNINSPATNACEYPCKYPNNCFQSACSTVYPCYPGFASKYATKDSLDLFLNETCVVQYR